MAIHISDDYCSHYYGFDYHYFYFADIIIIFLFWLQPSVLFHLPTLIPTSREFTHLEFNYKLAEILYMPIICMLYWSIFISTEYFDLLLQFHLEISFPSTVPHHNNTFHNKFQKHCTPQKFYGTTMTCVCLPQCRTVRVCNNRK